LNISNRLAQILSDNFLSAGKKKNTSITPEQGFTAGDGI